MCLAVVARVEAIEGRTALCDLDGARLKADLALIEELPQPGDYLMVHAGFAVKRLDVDEAMESIKFMNEILEEAVVEPTGERK